MHCMSRKHSSNCLAWHWLVQLIVYEQFGAIYSSFYYSIVQETSSTYDFWDDCFWWLFYGELIIVESGIDDISKVEPNFASRIFLLLKLDYNTDGSI